MCAYSCYPAKRSKKDEKGVDVGVMGNVELVQNATLSTQPINSVDWSPDKVIIQCSNVLILSETISIQEGLMVCTAFDQSVRVCIVTKLKRI